MSLNQPPNLKSPVPFSYYDITSTIGLYNTNHFHAGIQANYQASLSLKVCSSTRCGTSIRIEKNFSHAYLPRELANIIAVRQRQERAWHIRLSIWASVFSNIDSTLASY